MQPSENQPIRQYWQLCQHDLFPVLEERLGPLSENYSLLAAALAYLGDGGIAAPPKKRRGRQAHDRLPIFRALLAKSFLNLVSTRQLLEQLRHCGLRFIRVRGHAKVLLQVQLAILILTLERVLRLSP